MNKVLIYGGLGNQMFQYALCIALNKKGIKTRISFLNFLVTYHHNGFNLGRAFKLKLPFPLNFFNFFLQKGEFLYKNKFAFYFLRRFILKYESKRCRIYHEKKEFEYDNNIFNQHSHILIGIWQVEVYFKNVKDVLYKEFKFRKPKDKKNKILIEKINNCDSVSIHIRRGDYLHSQWKNAHAVINDISYYNKAANHIEQKIKNPHYFIFSDDIQWVKENLKLSNCTYVDHNKGKNSYIDMYLMSLCKHNIIANSTFSWWGAWLNKHENKIVIIPEPWLNTESCPGIYPSEWEKMNSISP
jgi:Glycosyl transferase family 11